MFRKSVLFLSLFFLLVFVNAQPFAADIAAFKKQDSISFPPKNAILFVGSSSFTNWKDVQTYFPKYVIINRGFGGSSLTDLIHYEKDIIFPYQPKQIIIYCGENDLAASDTVTAKMVYKRFVQLFEMIRKHLPGIPIAFVSLKPSPSRWSLRYKVMGVNKFIKEFLSKTANDQFIDVFYPMLDKNGLPIKEIFLEDNLHMNASGYAIWKKVIQPYLKN
jgi:lysophospholipase L1-like esterase